MSEAAVENVWDYPRPPRLEPTPSHLRIEHCGRLVAETRRAFRVLETSHPPVFYLPPEDVTPGVLRASSRRGSFCEWKGVASYWTLDLSGGTGPAACPAVPEACPAVPDAAWSYASPTAPFTALAGYLAFYASRVDTCTVDGERVQSQPGDFYGGWITRRVRGPFKGAPGTGHW